MINKYPYTDFNEYNMDWIIKTVKDLTVQWAETHQEWHDVQSEWKNYKNYIDNYFAQLNLSQEVSDKIDQMAADGYFSDLFNTLFRDDIVTKAGQITSDWIADNLLQETGYAIDASLTVANAAADAKSTGKNIEHVKLLTDISGNIPLTWEQGSVANNGTEVASTARIRTDYIIITDFTEIKSIIDAACECNYIFFDENKNAIAHTAYVQGDQELSLSAQRVYLRLSMKYSDESNIDPTNGNSLLSLNYKTVVNELKEDVKTITKNEVIKYLKDYYINLSGATANLIPVSTDSGYEVAVVPCVEGDRFCVSAEGQSATRPWGFVAADGTILEVAGANTHFEQLILTAPQNSAYFVSNNRYANFKSELTKGEMRVCDRLIYSPDQAKWYVLGDSISAGYCSMLTSDVPAGDTPAVSYADGTCAVWYRDKNYWKRMNDYFLKLNQENDAYPGQGYFRTAANGKNGIDVVNSISFADADMITVAWGFNDWHYDLARGDHTLIDPSEPIATTSTDVTQITTINQAIWYCLGVLIDKAPKARIIVVTPMNGWRYGGDFSTRWSLDYTLTNSGTLEDIRDDIIYWCDYYGLEYVDLTLNNPVVNYVNIKDILIDGSHPSEDGHIKLAKAIWTKIANN